MFKKRIIAVQVAAALSGFLTAAAPALAAVSVVETAQELRDAMETGANKIVIKNAGTIEIDQSLVYEGTAPLTIIGGGATIKGTADFTLLEVTKGANLKIRNLHLQGIGGFQAGDKGVVSKGIFIDVPLDREGTVKLDLTNVTVSDVGYHGVHVSDCVLEDEGDEAGRACGAGNDATGDGSDASVHVKLKNVVIENVGTGVFDGDGFRVDEREKGDILLQAVNSTFVRAGADGGELDEAGDGNVIISVRNSAFNENGDYCAGQDVNAPTDPKCVEEDDGELVLDLDDGFDIDEAGDGSIIGTLKNVHLDDNLDEGLDLDEEDEGGFDLNLTNVKAAGKRRRRDQDLRRRRRKRDGRYPFVDFQRKWRRRHQDRRVGRRRHHSRLARCNS